MKEKLLTTSPGERTFAIIFDTGDEIMAGLTSLASRHDIRSASFSAIGALQDVVLGWFDWEKKEYKRIPLKEQVEVLSLLGDISREADKPKVHAHIVVGAADGLAHGGHLLEGHVRPTLELFLRETDAALRRSYDPLAKISLIAIT